MNYQRDYLKCAFSGRLLFAEDQPVTATGPDGQILAFANDQFRRAHLENWSIERIAAELTVWQRPPPTAAGVDPITLEVVHNALTSVVAQMAEAMARTAYSPVFAEARDFTCALFDRTLELVAQYAGLPAQVGSMRYCVPWAIKKLGIANIRPGDVIAHNDPQVGTPHLPEFCVIRPIFADGVIVMYAATIAHQTDIGGKSPGSMPGDANEIFQEGLLIPPVKLLEQGAESESVFRMLLANVRSPLSMQGDISAMCGSLIVAERLVRELAQRHGWRQLELFGDELKNYAERRFRAEIAKLPSGIYRASSIIDDDGVAPGHHVVKLTLVVREDGIIADFRGSSPQARGPINCSYSVSCAASLNAMLHIVEGDLPNNEGLHRAIRVIAPPGSIMNVNHPGAYNSGNTETHNLVVEAFMAALIAAVPERCCAPSASTTCLVTGGARNPAKGETYTFVIWDGAGWGASQHRDGNSAISRYVGTISKNYPTEVLETHFPWLTRFFEFRTDSAGAGRFRGGLGCRRDSELRAPELEFGVNSNRGYFPPQGVFGGGAASPTRYWVWQGERWKDPLELGLRSPDKFSGVHLRANDRLMVETPGGGGWGDPRERDPEQVRSDLRDELISREAAVEVYGLPAEEADAIVARYHWVPRP
jgi:N-methylhydantoinase B/oxoprolinase/acetone carboxylase alpha subunit